MLAKETREATKGDVVFGSAQSEGRESVLDRRDTAKHG